MNILSTTCVHFSVRLWEYTFLLSDQCKISSYTIYYYRLHDFIEIGFFLSWIRCKKFLSATQKWTNRKRSFFHFSSKQILLNHIICYCFSARTERLNFFFSIISIVHILCNTFRIHNILNIFFFSRLITV